MDLRSTKGAHDAVSRFRFLSDKPYSSEWVLNVDIENCFDTLSHDFINKELEPILFVIGRSFVKEWLRAGIVEKGAITYPKTGTPQGGPTSPILSNLCLNGVDRYCLVGQTTLKSIQKNIKLWKDAEVLGSQMIYY